MIRALHKHLGIPAEVLIQEPGGTIPEDVEGRDWGRFPVVEMAKRGFIKAKKNVKENAERLLRDLMSRAGGIEVAAPLPENDGARGMQRWIATRSPDGACTCWPRPIGQTKEGLSQRGHHARIPARSREAERIRGWAEAGAETSWPRGGSP